jgi:hypothetical protein
LVSEEREKAVKKNLVFLVGRKRVDEMLLDARNVSFG